VLLKSYNNDPEYNLALEVMKLRNTIKDARLRRNLYNLCGKLWQKIVQFPEEAPNKARVLLAFSDVVKDDKKTRNGLITHAMKCATKPCRYPHSVFGWSRRCQKQIMNLGVCGPDNETLHIIMRKVTSWTLTNKAVKGDPNFPVGSITLSNGWDGQFEQEPGKDHRYNVKLECVRIQNSWKLMLVIEQAPANSTGYMGNWRTKCLSVAVIELHDVDVHLNGTFKITTHDRHGFEYNPITWNSMHSCGECKGTGREGGEGPKLPTNFCRKSLFGIGRKSYDGPDQCSSCKGTGTPSRRPLTATQWTLTPNFD